MKRGLGTKRQRKEDLNNMKGSVESFWTICPYCYYIYEYEIVYLDCCLRCQNCKKAFHAVAIKGPLPEITMADRKGQYNVSLALFKICYSDEAVAVVDDEKKKVDVDSKTTVGYRTEDLIDVDAGSNNIQRKRVVASHESGHLNVKEFCEKLGTIGEKLGTIDEDDHALQEIMQSQSRIGGEFSNVQMMGTGERIRSGIENRRGLMADHLEKGRLNGESEHQRESKFCEREFYMDDDDIYVGLTDL